jgi:hypothetical protein
MLSRKSKTTRSFEHQRRAPSGHAALIRVASIVISVLKAPGIKQPRCEVSVTIPAKVLPSDKSMSRSVGFADNSTSGLLKNSSTVATPVRRSTMKASATERASIR